jgi:glycosyltransferase involved in cell wall biosynthesis
MNDIDLGIVVPLYNKEDTVAQAVGALLDQTVPPAQVVVVNDGSTDASVARLSHLAHNINLVHKANAGCAAARNTGIGHIRTEWVAFADADDVWYPERIEKIRAFLAQHPDVDWLSGQYRAIYADGREEIVPAWGQGDAVLTYFDHADGWTGLHCPETLVIRRDLLEEVGRFSGRLRCYEVTLMYCALALRRPRMGFLAEPTLDFYYGTPSSLYDERRACVETLCAYAEELLALESRFTPTPPYLRKLITETFEEALYFAHRRGQDEVMRYILREYGTWLRRPVRWKTQLRCGLARLRTPLRVAG